MSDKQPTGKTEVMKDKATEDEERRKENENIRKEEQKKYEEKQKEKEQKMKKEMTAKPYKMSLWLRLVNIILGIAFVGLSFYALANEDLTVENTIYILAAILAFSGLARFVNAFYDKEIGGTKRLLRFLFSVVLIGLAAVVFFYPDIGEDVLYLLLAIGLVFQGLGRLMLGLTHEAFPFWMKSTQLVFGLASVGLGVAAGIPSLVELNFDVTVLTLLVIGFFVSGLSRVTMGLVGLRSEKQKRKG